ncbi:MAG TPA: energy transducer TonB [Vicinamibacterales bacterium]|nr:energy transducer TonB [Vicinamibacterales bacterium]
MSDILLVRSREAEGLQRMILWSLAGHLVLVILLALMPSEWRTARAEPESTPMVISLGGPPGPDAGGQNPVAGRAVQVVAPDPKLPFAPAPAPKMPEMTVPEAPPKPAPRPAPKPPAKPAERSSSRKPTAGEEIKAGAARVETGGAAVPFGGLSTGGAGGGGARVSGLENFCCPEYITTMEQMIRRYWNPRQGVAGRVVVKFTIRRDGMLTNVEVTQPSNNFLLDSESRRAILTLQRLPPLPEPYTEPLLTIHLTFEYQR